MEKWTEITGFTGYEVSTHGHVRSVLRTQMKPDINKGYERVMLYNRDGKRRMQVHRLVAGAFIGQCPDGYQVNHKDGNPANNCVENLEYVTSKENHAHSWRELGRKPPHRGEQTHFAKLSDSDVIKIRRLRSEGLMYKTIAERFNTKTANIWHICQGKTWKHLL